MENKENIKKIFEGFYGPDDAHKHAQDIADADKLFSNNPAPRPNEFVINKIKSKVGSAIAAKKRKQLRLRFVKLVSVAAVMVLGFAVTMMVVENQIKGSIVAPLAEEVEYQQLDNMAVELTAVENYASDVVSYDNDSFTEIETENGNAI
jgi:hypothetical protein